MLQDQDHENKINLKTLEGEEELLVDKLEDIGVYSLNKDQSIEWRTYTNKFSCNSVSLCGSSSIIANWCLTRARR